MDIPVSASDATQSSEPVLDCFRPRLRASQ